MGAGPTYQVSCPWEPVGGPPGLGNVWTCHVRQPGDLLVQLTLHRLFSFHLSFPPFLPTLPMDDRDLIFDWNDAGERWEKPPFQVQFYDETLRDGLQSPSVKAPEIEDKLAILHLMDRLGI